MRTVAVIVLFALVAAALWLLKPELFQGSMPDPEVTAPTGSGHQAPATAQAPRSPARQHEPASSGQQASDAAQDSRPTARRQERPAAKNAVLPGAPPAQPAAPASEPLAVEREARQYVSSLTRTEPAPVSAERADHFVPGDQVLKLVPDSAMQTTSLARLQDSQVLKPDTPITVVRSVEQVEQVGPDTLIADSAGNLDAPVQQILADESVRETTLRAVLEQLRATPQAMVRVLRHVEYFEQTTLGRLLSDRSTDRALPIKIVKRTHGMELASVRDLLPARTLSPDTLFYVRTVRETDVQGIWGIVHDGLIKNFAQGIAIRRGQEINTYQVDIPRDADEIGNNARSSFLGKLIHQKSLRSYVYNLRENRMGRNPDRIYPGREIIIVDFEPDELIGIYKHFVNEQG